VFTISASVLHDAIFWGWILFVDVIQRHHLLEHCRIKDASNRKTPCRERVVRSVALRTAFVHAVIHPLTSYLCHRYIGARNPHFELPWAPLGRSLSQQCFSFAKLILFNEFATWFVHRLTHTPYLYRKMHCMHHVFLVPEAIGGEHAHSFEHFLGTQLVVILFMSGTDPDRPTPDVATFLVWMALKVEESCHLHSGYDFNSTFLGRLGLLQGWRSRFHFAHHTKGWKPQNLSSLMLADYLFGTMTEFIEEEEQRLKCQN
jgi:sterol desaturase/sphingolipid hydroxylase (fatty acid hydroxylase superfamily)